MKRLKHRCPCDFSSKFANFLASWKGKGESHRLTTTTDCLHEVQRVFSKVCKSIGLLFRTSNLPSTLHHRTKSIDIVGKLEASAVWVIHFTLDEKAWLGSAGHSVYCTIPTCQTCTIYLPVLQNYDAALLKTMQKSSGEGYLWRALVYVARSSNRALEQHVELRGHILDSNVAL